MFVQWMCEQKFFMWGQIGVGRLYQLQAAFFASRFVIVIVYMAVVTIVIFGTMPFTNSPL